MSKLWQIVAGAMGAIITGLLVVLNVTQRQKDKAEQKAGVQERRADSAEARIDQREKADDASQKAKEEGDERVEEVRKQAGSGKRDFFESDSLRDND